MLFDRPAQLPVATVRSRSWSAVGARLHGSVVARWRWFKPRTLPVLVALAGMMALLASTNYLSNLAHHTQERSIPVRLASDQVMDAAEATPGFVRIHVASSRVVITIDSNPPPVGTVLQLPSSGDQITLVAQPQR
jgi:hypothetical protein